MSSSGRWPALQDPAPPVALLRWGFGGDGDGRRTAEGDPDDQGNGETKPTSRADDSKTRSRNSVRRTSARNTAPLKPTTAAHQQPRPAVQPTVRHESKGAHLIAMLRAPDGATIAAMARAAKWQPHSVRGFLAGVVRKKLGLTLVSANGESGRVYRITDRTALAAA